ncbi:MAG: HmuY family protein [Cytophagales bacterium]|nr:HmuY family protein [Bernardetiaceae bacterium]MDW8204837.1 HmuY family protein [Cytophagales bacterium]
MKNFAMLLSSAMLALALTSCKEDNVTPVQPVVTETVRDLPADPVRIDPATGRPLGGTNRFTLYSLRENRIVANSDSATNKWDIGLRGTTLIVNGGAIRSGQGGAFIFTGLFDELKEIPATATFRTDQSPSDLAIPNASGQGWYNYNSQTHLITPIPGRVIVLRTGDGKFAKVEILSYYKGAPAAPTSTSESRHYTFRFSFQPDGSRKF